jgi:hypothetical protein
MAILKMKKEYLKYLRRNYEAIFRNMKDKHMLVLLQKLT